MTLGRHLHRALFLSAVLAISHLGCGGSEGVKKPSTTGVYTPSEKGEDQIRVASVGPTSHRAPATAVQPAPQPAAAEPAAAVQPTAEPANATKTAAADDEPTDDEPAAEPAPHKSAKGKKSASKAKKHHRSKKHHK